MTDLANGYHELYLTDGDSIPFEAGDVIGLQFEDYNPIPYDLRHQSCTSDEKVLYLADTDLQKSPILHEGAVYAFQEKPDSWKACRMYSLYATYSGDGMLYYNEVLLSMK